MKIEDAKMREIERDVARLGKLEARVGVFGKSGSVPDDPTFTYAELAYVNEFGSQAAGVPQRSLIRSAFEGQRRALDKVAARTVNAVVSGRISPEDAAGVLGQWGVARVRENMTRGIAPALAASTLEKRRRVQRGRQGRDVPLIDSGRLRQAVDSDVRERSSK